MSSDPRTSSQPDDCREVQAVLWEVGSPPPQADKFKPVLMDYDHPTRFKPQGGLWTSTFLGREELSGWAQWCRVESFGYEKADLWLLTPDPAAEVYVVDTYRDLDMLHRLYGRTHRWEGMNGEWWEDPYLDWPLIAERWSGVRLTDEGQWATRLTDPYNLYGWDCESTLWLRWSFTDIQHGGIVEVLAQSGRSES